MSQEHLGYLKYEGALVEQGYIDARKSAEALISFDKAVRYFLYQQNPALSGIEFEIPVKVQKGSWEALIPDGIVDWLITTGALAGAAYATTAATQAAKHDFEEIGFKELIKSSVRYIQYFVQVGKHLGTLTVKSFGDLTWRNNNTEVGIVNADGEILFLPAEFLKYYEKCSPQLLKELAILVEAERTLKIGVADGDDDSFVEESISLKDRRIFAVEAPEDDEELFPELKHGDIVELEGQLTRGTQTANSLGFKYHDHILTCYPEAGSIVKFKPALFLRCVVRGQITRADKHGHLGALRPKIIISEVEQLESDPEQRQLWQ